MLCENCKKYDTCKEICPELSRELDRKPSDRLYSDRHIRRKEVPYDPAALDEFLPLEAIRRIKGGKKRTFNSDKDE